MVYAALPAPAPFLCTEKAYDGRVLMTKKDKDVKRYRNQINIPTHARFRVDQISAK